MSYTIQAFCDNCGFLCNCEVPDGWEPGDRVSCSKECAWELRLDDEVEEA